MYCKQCHADYELPIGQIDSCPYCKDDPKRFTVSVKFRREVIARNEEEAIEDFRNWFSTQDIGDYADVDKA